jgi:diaminohydroxyphosphoribosylaminopyrimidine deaminase/5-amino-6-(5-phosphoribosylamino)uracil reductase
MNATQSTASPRTSKLMPRRWTTRIAGVDTAEAELFMRCALREARKGIGRTSPNPAVGAVLVKSGRIIARGHHKKAGAPHAEVVAIELAGAQARGADLYITLEPCDHFGRTPPCTHAILRAGVKRVICASLDPFPLVNGRGVARLRRAGVPVLTGVLRGEADRINRPYFKRTQTGLPWVTLKAAISLDGKIATSSGDSRWISGQAAREYVHRLRNQVDAILVGATTAGLDNPRLTTRLPRKVGRNAIRVVVDSRLRLPPRLKLFGSTRAARTIVATVESDDSKAKKLARQGVEVWKLAGRAGRVDLLDLLQHLGAEGVLHLLVEGGAEVYGSFLDQRFADELVLFIAPKLVGSRGLSWTGRVHVDRISDAVALEELIVRRKGNDVLVRGLLANRRWRD